MSKYKNDLCGIYMIHNLVNHKRYIGSSLHIYERWDQHEDKLEKECHVNIHLQSAWNKYGSENFEFLIVELCSPDELIPYEQFWSDYYDSFHHGYSLAPIVNVPHKPTIDRLKNDELTISYNKFYEVCKYLTETDYSITKISKLTHVGFSTIYQIYFKTEYSSLTKNMIFKKRTIGRSIRKLSQDIILLLINDMRNENNYDRILSEKYGLSISSISDIRNHKTYTELTQGITFPKSDGKKFGKGNCKEVDQYERNGTFVATYKSAREAERVTGISHKLISSVCNGDKKIAKDYVWRIHGESFAKYDCASNNDVAVDQYDKNGKLIATYNQIREASNITGICAKSIGSVIHGKIKSAGGYYWTKRGEIFEMPQYQRKKMVS